jgi:DNA polymerase family B
MIKSKAEGSTQIKKQKIISAFKKITVPYVKLNKISFLNILFLNLQLRSVNTILFQYTNYEQSIYYMLGKQVGVVVQDSHELNHYKNLFEHYRETLELLMDRYELDNPDFITFHFKTLHLEEDLFALKKNLNIELHKGLVKIAQTKKKLNSKILPYTNKEKYLGYLLIDKLRYRYLSDLISLLEKNEFIVKARTEYPVSFPLEYSNYNKDWQKSFGSGLEFLYYVQKSESENIKVFLHVSRRYLLISIKLQDNLYNRYVFNLKTGQFLFLSHDILKLDESFKYLYNVKDENLWVRKTGGTSLVFNKNSNIQALVAHIPLKAIKYLDFNKNNNLEKQRRTPPQPMSNPNYGVLDLETFVDKNEQGERYSRVFSLGFLTKTDKKPKMFYLTEYFDNTTSSSNKLVLKCIDEMLNYANSNYIFYVHNLGRFDVIFLQKILLDYNLNVKDKYILTPLYRDNKILRLVIKLKENRSIKISLVDSLNLLNDNLSKLSKDYNVKTTKGYFPYSFVNKHNLNYEGLTPHISYYNSNVDKDWYYSTLSLNWNMKNESLNYLSKDLFSLLEILEKFQSHLFIDHNLEMTDCLTISSLARNKFLKHYLNKSKIPLINNNTLFNFIYSAYFGGNTEVYKPFGRNLIYLDVNSLYPYNAINPMPGIDCNWVESFDEIGLDLDQLFGVFHAKVITSDLYIGLLPVKTKRGLIFPNGKISGIWTSIELQFAKKYGYKITVTKGYQFNKSENVFKAYVEDLSKLKNELTGSKRQVIKSLLNNLLGRFALNHVKPITKTVNKKVLDKILATRAVNTFKEINSDSFILTYMPLLDKEICESHNIDYYKAILNDRSHNIEKLVNVFQDTSIIISAFTTSYARIQMNQIKLDILAAGGLLYYSDTDSIVTDLSLDKLKEVMPEKVGKELGQLKFEYQVKKGYFISNKVYALLLNDGTIIKKGKGFSTDSISLFEYEKLYLYSQSIKANKNYGITNYSLGSVLINSKKIIIDWNSYIKRDKIYNYKTNLWIDTRPLLFDNVTKFITVYIKKEIIKFTKPLDFDKVTKSITIYTPKNIIKIASLSYSNPDF